MGSCSVVTDMTIFDLFEEWFSGAKLPLQYHSSMKKEIKHGFPFFAVPGVTSL